MATGHGETLRHGARAVVLHADHDESTLERATSAVVADPELVVETVTDAERVHARLATGRFDCLVCEPAGLGGVSFLREVRTARPELPLVVYADRLEGRQGSAIADSRTEGDPDARSVADWVDANGPADCLSTGGDDWIERLRNRVHCVVSTADATAPFERYWTVLEAIDDPVYVLNGTGEFTLVNDAFCRATGYDRGAIIGRDESLVERTELSAPDGGSLQRRLRDASCRTGQVEVTLVTATGETLYCEDHVSLLPAGAGEFAGSVGVLRDISTRKRRERELERYEEVIELAADGMYLLDERGAFREVNGRMADLTGYDESELFAQGPSACLTDETFARFESEIQNQLSASRPWGSVEGDVETADGDLVPVEVRITLLSRDGEFDGTIGIVRDITDRLERERELERQNQRLEEFAGIVSHDLRNPLNVAQGRLELLSEGIDSDELPRVRQALTRMDDIIDDVLTLTRHGDTDVDPRPLAFEPLVAEAWGTVEGPDASLTVAGDLGTISADRSRLRRVLENLFRNAVEHAGPDVTVRLGRLAEGAGFYVEDDGAGVPPAERTSIFEAGYSSSRDGTGYGLEIVRELVAAHGWEVEVRDGNDGGARFAVTGVGDP